MAMQSQELFPFVAELGERLVQEDVVGALVSSAAAVEGFDAEAEDVAIVDGGGIRVLDTESSYGCACTV